MRKPWLLLRHPNGTTPTHSHNMAKAKAQSQPLRIERSISRPGVHAKKKQGTHKAGKNWKKPYRGQGR